MGIFDILKPVTGMFGDVFGRLAQYWWVLFIALGIGIIVAVFFFIKILKQKKAQWTHTLEIKRVLKNNLLSDPLIHKMRRFPLIKNAEVFELEKPLLGSYLLPEPGKYSGLNRYSLILDSDNRVWRNEGEYFSPVDGSVNVSSRHAEIDLQLATLKSDWQNINKITKRLDWGQIAKYVMMTILILAVMIVGIVAIGEWGNSQKERAESEKAIAGAMVGLSKGMEVNLETANTNLLILDKLNELYKTNNIAGTIRTLKNETL